MKKKQHWTKEFAAEIPYFRVLKQFMDLDYFGVATKDDRPVHVNSEKNPYPIKTKTGIRVKEKVTLKRVRAHLSGEKALFLVNSPDGKVHEITFDLDPVDKNLDYCDPAPLVKFIVDQFCPEGVVPFIEPSRHGKGAYVRLLVCRSSDPAPFNALLMKISRVIRLLNPLFAQFNIKLDGVKGTVWYKKANPKFSKQEYKRLGKAYEDSKRTYVGTFTPNKQLERNKTNRGLLVTAPCHGAYVDGDFDRFEKYVEWATYKEGKKLLGEDFLRQWLADNAPAPQEEKAKCVGGEAESEGRAPISGAQTSPYVMPQRSGGGKGRDLSGVQRRVRCFNEVTSCDPDATPEDVLKVYHTDWDFTGSEASDVANRLKDFQRLHQRGRLSPEGRAPISGANTAPYVSFKNQRHLPLIESLVPSSVYDWVGPKRQRIYPQMLADFLGVKLQDSFSLKTNNYFGSASRDATIAYFKNLKGRGLVQWGIDNRQYKKLLDVAKEYNLLKVYEKHIPPTRNRLGGRIYDHNGKRVDGVARIIGPGSALPELQKEFELRYNEWKAANKPANLKVG